MPKSPWLRPSAARISSENSEIKNVWPSDDQNAMIMPNSKKRHSTRINLVVLTDDKRVAGDSAIRKAVENAEDSTTGAWNDLQAYELHSLDTVVGIAASGTTPYVIGGIEAANNHGLLTGCITCNAGSPLGMAAQHEIAVVVGPEFLTGSTRMKSGTAQKMVLNMITTATMIKLGRVKGNKMVDMQLSNDKLVNRGTRMVADELGIESELAQELLLKHGSVRAAVDSYNNERK